MNDELMPDPAALWLCQLPGMTSLLVLQLLETFGSAAGIMRASSNVLRQHRVPPALIARIVAGPREVPQVAAGLKAWQRLGIVPLPLAAPSYPQRLLELEAPPLVVYVQGAWPVKQPLVLAVPAEDGDQSAMAKWTEFVHGSQLHVGFAGLTPDLAPDTAPAQLVGVPYGLMLARQRLPLDAWQHVANGALTLLSVTPPTSKPSMASLQAAMEPLFATLMALVDAVVIAAPFAPLAEEVLLLARSRGKTTYAFGLPSRASVPLGVRRLRTGKAGVQGLLARLGVHDAGTGTVQQERLF